MKLSRIICIVAFAAFAQSVNASTTEPLVLNYDGFYDRIEKLNEPEFQKVKLAFYLRGLTDGAPCKIESAKLKTKLKSKDIYFYDDGEILLPLDRKFDEDKANLVIVKGDEQNCGLDMRLESVVTFNEEIKPEYLIELSNVFNLALKEQTGMLSFLAPEVTGVTLLVEEGTQLQILNSDIGQCLNNRCTITNKELTEIKQSIVLSSAPRKIIPYIKK